MTTKKPLLGNRSVAEKLEEINHQQNDAVEVQQVMPHKKTSLKIALDEATLETLKQKHNLVEGTSKASFHWKSSQHKALRNLAIDTGRSVEEYLAEWATKGLEEARKKFYKEI